MDLSRYIGRTWLQARTEYPSRLVGHRFAPRNTWPVRFYPPDAIQDCINGCLRGAAHADDSGVGNLGTEGVGQTYGYPIPAEHHLVQAPHGLQHIGAPLGMI